MDETSLAIKFLGTALILLIIVIVVCFLASLGYNTYIKYSDNKKKIEACAKKAKQHRLPSSMITLSKTKSYSLLFY